MKLDDFHKDSEIKIVCLFFTPYKSTVGGKWKEVVHNPPLYNSTCQVFPVKPSVFNTLKVDAGSRSPMVFHMVFHGFSNG